MLKMGDLTLQPTPPVPPEIEGYLKKLKRKTRSLTGNWTKRWFFVDPRRREFGYSDNRTSAPRSSIYLDNITAVVQFDDTHFQVESRTRNFFLCGDSKASTVCWVTSLETYRKKLAEYEKDKIAYDALAASASSVAATLRLLPQPSPSPAAHPMSSKKKKSRDNSDGDDRQSSSSSSMSSTNSSSKAKRERGKAEYPEAEQRFASPLAKDNRRSSSRSKNRSPPPSPPSSSEDKQKRERQRDRERGRDLDRDRKFERSNRETSNDRDRSESRDRGRLGNTERDRSRDRNGPASSVRGSVIQAWVDDF